MSTVTPKVLKFKMIVVQPREADEGDMSEEDKKIKSKSLAWCVSLPRV